MTVMTTRRTVSACGPLPAGDVWERYAIPARWPGWAPHLTSVTASTPRIEPGTHGTVRAVGIVPARFRITSVDEARQEWSWVADVGPVRLALTHWQVPMTGARPGTRAYVAVEGPAPVVRAYAPMARWALRRLVSR